jgi:hypothetical protein
MIWKKSLARPKALKQLQETTPSLLSALQFISAAQTDVGALYQTHCMIKDGWIKAFDGVLTIGAKVDIDLAACPHTLTFLDAVAKSGSNFAIVQLAPDKIAVKGPNGFRAFVSCLADPATLANIPPDANIAPVNGELVKALAAVHPVVSDKGERLVEKAILLRSGSALACDGKLAVECWHGLDLPSVLLPKAAALALIKAGKEPVGFGVGKASVTFHFADESWIRTQLYIETYPAEQIDGILNEQYRPWPLPANFFEALKAIESFSEGIAYFGENMLRTHNSGNVGATHELHGIPANVAYKIKYLLAAQSFMERVDFQGRKQNCYFQSDNVRGVIMQWQM